MTYVVTLIVVEVEDVEALRNEINDVNLDSGVIHDFKVEELHD